MSDDPQPQPEQPAAEESSVGSQADGSVVPPSRLIRLPSEVGSDIRVLADGAPTPSTNTRQHTGDTDLSPTASGAHGAVSSALEPLSGVSSTSASTGVSPSGALYVLASPDPVEVTSHDLAAKAAHHGARASISSVTGKERAILVDTRSSTTQEQPQAPSTPSRRPPATPSPTATRGGDRVLEFVALYSYDASPFVRTSHASGPSGLDFITGTALKGELAYCVPSGKDHHSKEDLTEKSLQHFVFAAGLKLEVAPTPPLLHSFVLTQTDGTRMYAYVYTKWHVVPDHVLTVVKMQIGESLIDCDDPSPQNLPSTLYGPHSLVFISAFPFYDAVTTMLKYLAERFFLSHVPSQAYVSPGGGLAASPSPHPSLPNSMQLIDAIYAVFRDVTPTRLPLAHMDIRLSHMYPHSLEFRDAVTSMCAKQYHPQDDDLDDSGTGFLLDTTPASADPVELINQIYAALRTCLTHCPFVLPAAPFDNLPLLEATTLGTLFDSLDVSHVIAVWNALLCELPCLFVSAHLSKLTPCLEALSALLYPMRWSYVYIPVLPIFLTDVLDAPQPFMIGAPRGVLDALPDALITGETNVVIVDLDFNTLCMSGNLEATQRRAAKAASAAAIAAAVVAAGGKTPPKHVDDPADANPFPDPFSTNPRLLSLLLQSQGIGQDDSAGAHLERLLSNNPVTYLGASLLDSVSLAPALSFSGLNPFKSSSSSTPVSAPSLDGAPSGNGSDAHTDVHDDVAVQTQEARHRFLPWNLVWRLFDGVSSIVNPLLTQQRELDMEADVLPRTPSSALDVSSSVGGMNLLAGLPPNLPTHAWPVLLPGLVRDWRASLNNSKNNDLDLRDPSLVSALSYLGNEAFFLQRFQGLLEKAKKPVLLLSTTRFLYSGTDVSESEGELADEEEPQTPGPTPSRTVSKDAATVQEEQRRGLVKAISMNALIAASNTQASGASDSTSPAHRHHPSASAVFLEDSPPPALLHMTSTPQVAHRATMAFPSPQLSSPTSRDMATPQMHRAASASVSVAMLSSSAVSSPKVGRGTQLPAFVDDEDDEDDTEATDGVASLRLTVSPPPPARGGHRASEPPANSTSQSLGRPLTELTHVTDENFFAAPSGGHGRTRSLSSAPPPTRGSISTGPRATEAVMCEMDAELDAFIVRGRDRASIINEVVLPLVDVPAAADLSRETTEEAVDLPPFVAAPLPLRELASSSPTGSIWPSVSGADLLSLRRRFLSVLVSLLHSHRAFTGFSRKELDLGGATEDDEESYEVTFEIASYLRYMHRDYRPFLSLFLETQMYKFFSEERLTRESAAAAPVQPATAPPSTLRKSGSQETLNASTPSSPTSNGSSLVNSVPSPSPPPPSVPNDWFDRLCAQKRTRTRLLMNAWGENGLGGLLYKLGRNVPTWKERWFELNRHGTILRYYAHSTKMAELEPSFRELKRRFKLSPRDLVTKANLDRVADQREKLRASLIRGEITIVPGQTSVLIPSQSRKYMTCYCFEVVTPTRSLLACAPDLKTRDEWILCIRARAAKLSIDHKRVGPGSGPAGLGTVPHLESRLQMQLRLLREKNIASLTRNFMDNLHQRQQKFIAGESAAEGVKRPRPPRSTAPALTGTAGPLSLPHALLVCEHLRTSLDLRKFSTLFKTHLHCFSGREATHYILHQNLCDSLADSVTLCNLMLTSGLVLNVNHSATTPFKSDAKYMYSFPKLDLLHGAGIGDADSASGLLPSEEERVIVARMREELDVRDRVHGLFRTVAKECFVAKDAIAWLLDRGICSNESAAVRLATRLVRTRQLTPASGSAVSSSSSASCVAYEFVNNMDLYRFHSNIRAQSSSSNLLTPESSFDGAMPYPKVRGQK